jgi:trimeric autotransporter adhesin
MNDRLFLPVLGLLLASTLPLPAVAQMAEQTPSQVEEAIAAEANEASTADPETSISTEAIDLKISPRGGVGYNTSGAGFDSTTRLEAFLPLLQDIGEELTFLDSRLLLDNEGNLGANILLGYRNYDEGGDRIWGGYAGIDLRETDASSFSQLGVGVESLGRVWDFRANGYFPLGDTQQVIDESIRNGAVQTSSGFQGNLLVLARSQERSVSRTFESALGGFDLEVGARLARWDEGDLRGYVGAYLLDGVDVEGRLGWKVRLESRPIDNLHLNVGLQDDDIFGTNVNVSVGLAFPRIRPRGPIDQPEQVVARLGDPLIRNNSIAVEARQETKVEVERTTRPLMNPEEERPYRFQHVTLGAQGGDGTFERPFGTVQAALAATRSDGNDIVYVDQGSNAAIPALTIPSRVQVLSQAPVQILAGMPFPGFPRGAVRLPFSPTTNFNEGISVRLPLSGDGRFPTIQDSRAGSLVTLGDRTTLSGFRLVDASDNAIVGTNIANVEIRDNTITNASNRGVFLTGVTDSIVMFNNTITGSRGGAGSGQGILIRNGVDDSAELTIADHQLSNNRVGIEISGTGDTNRRLGAEQRVTIGDTTLQANREQGLFLTAEQFANQIVNFTDGTISNNGSNGVEVFGTRGSSQELTLTASTVSGNQGDGIRVFGGTLGGSSTSAQEIFVQNNTIERNTGFGLNLAVNEVSAQEFAINDNTIRNNGGGGIRAVANNLGFQEFVTDATNGSSGINNNTISGNGGQGISLVANDTATLVADLQNNRIEANTTAGQPDLEVANRSNTAKVCVVAINNTSRGGIRLDNNSAGAVQGLFEVGDVGTVSARNVGDLGLAPNAAAFTNKPGATSCFR